jgi:Ca-activated chloride channel family protein
MSRLRSFLIGAVALPALLVPSSISRPRATGSIAGRVSSPDSAPLAGAMVAVTGTQLVAQTGKDGRYRIDAVPTGRATVTARMIGYRAVTRQVTVGEGVTATADFVLTNEPLRLEEIVTSGVAAGARTKKALGFAIMKRAVAATAMRDYNTEEYRRISENAWQAPTRTPLSTFSIDVDAASYTNIRRFVGDGQLPPKDAVRIEEMINYFPYDYPDPTGEAPFSVTTELAAAPWHPGHRLALIGLQGRRIPMEALPPNNLVFLLDVSGSMDDPRKLPLVKSAFRLLVNQLRPQDKVAIVVYAGAAGLVLAPTPGDKKDLILDALERLEPGGSTAGAAGIQLAYETARKNFLAEGNNRVILATDGDFNVGVSSDGELTRLIEAERGHGVFLTVLGFGTGNLKDAKMEQLADQGNGHYAYVNDILEARKVFVQELGATLLTLAKDVKIQVEFNPARVAAYRLIGYENRVLADQDFNNDAKDAGELGAGHAVTALYEIVPAGSPLDVTLGKVDYLKYQPNDPSDRQTSVAGHEDEWMTVKLRYKAPQGSTSRLLARAVRGETLNPSETFRFASAVAGVGMLLRDSEYKGKLSYDALLAQARDARGADRDGYRGEFVRLTETIATLSRRIAAGPREP